MTDAESLFYPALLGIPLQNSMHSVHVRHFCLPSTKKTIPGEPPDTLHTFLPSTCGRYFHLRRGCPGEFSTRSLREQLLSRRPPSLTAARVCWAILCEAEYLRPQDHRLTALYSS
ncbi:hypothetical protein BaRGS_00025524 [Batillaria attramentaria]|uniref:Uncharacterized protein n=1 Tax=Batillaria attramentaria TaxID=370345 RepID=A0ABD0K829_9CAEN